MPVLTALKPTRRAGRFAVHIDGEYAFAASEAFVARHGLYEGRRYDDRDCRELQEAAQQEAALGHAYRLLAHRLRSRAEVRRRLRQKGHGAEQIEAVIARLAGEGLLDDAAFAQAFVADKVNLAGWGRERIVRELAHSGLSDDVVQSAVSGLEEGDEYERAVTALRRHGPLRPPLDRARKRAYEFLVRRGFSSPIAYRAVARWVADEQQPD